jgi:hypothetical protein
MVDKGEESGRVCERFWGSASPDGTTALLDGIPIVAWAALLGGGGLFRPRNGERNTERKPRFFSDILSSDIETLGGNRG